MSVLPTGSEQLRACKGTHSHTGTCELSVDDYPMTNGAPYPATVL